MLDRLFLSTVDLNTTVPVKKLDVANLKDPTIRHFTISRVTLAYPNLTFVYNEKSHITVISQQIDKYSQKVFRVQFQEQRHLDVFVVSRKQYERCMDQNVGASYAIQSI